VGLGGIMTRVECLAAMDDLLVAAWELRDTTKSLIRNECWELIHRTPRPHVLRMIEQCDLMCERFTKRMNNYEDMILDDLIEDYDAISDKLTELAAVDVMRYHKMYNQILDYRVDHTPKMRLRKSLIRR
jgi:hypothetical protein